MSLSVALITEHKGNGVKHETTIMSNSIEEDMRNWTEIPDKEEINGTAICL